jgi:hypothetical protein
MKRIALLCAALALSACGAVPPPDPDLVQSPIELPDAAGGACDGGGVDLRIITASGCEPIIENGHLCGCEGFLCCKNIAGSNGCQPFPFDDPKPPLRSCNTRGYCVVAN